MFHVTAEREMVNHFVRFEHCVVCVTVTYLRIAALQAAELNICPHTASTDRYRRKGMVLPVHETTPTTKYETATCLNEVEGGRFQ